MKIIVIFFLLFPFIRITQISGCFRYSDRVYEEFNFIDSTFTYQRSAGLANASVNGKYREHNDTLILNSEFQPDDYKIYCFQDSIVLKNYICIQIKQIASFNVIDVQSKIKGEEYLNFNGRIIYHSKKDIFSEEYDTIITEYLISRDSIRDNLEVIIWRKGQTINLPIDSNRCNIDLTNYPKWYDYVFFENQKAVLLDQSIILIDAHNKPIKTKYTIRKRKKITTSKKKKIKRYLKCT